MTRRIATAGLVALLWVWPAVAQNGYRNVVNQRWNAVADGPLGGEVVDVDAAGQPLQRSRAARANGAPWTPLWFRQAQRAGLLAPDQPAPVLARTRFLRHNGRLVTPDLDRMCSAGRARAEDSLTFTYNPRAGDTAAVPWSNAQQQAVAAFLTGKEADFRRVYGAPAFGHPVRVVHDPAVGGLNMVVYDASRDEIRWQLLDDRYVSDPATSRIDDRDLHTLAYAVLLAHRDDLAIGFDAWELGMARAAQLLVVSTALPDFSFLARDFNLLFGAYDLLNQPGLEGPSFESLDIGAAGEGVRSEMAVYRAYMCQGAWLKLVAEAPDAFARFNAAYYARAKTDPSLRYDVPHLRNLMTGVVAQVEGTGFADWYVRQYCLDTSLVPGAKLYVYNLPRKEVDDDQIANTLTMDVLHFQVTALGEQLPLSGLVKFSYAAFDGWPLDDAVYGSSGVGGIEARLGEAGNAPGVGTAVAQFFGIAGDQNVQRQRVVVTASVNGLARRLYYANDVYAGDDGRQNHLFGLVTNGQQGRLHIAIAGRDAVETQVVQGAFSARLGAVLPTVARATLTWTPAGAGAPAATVVRNVMFLGPMGSGRDVAEGFVALNVETPPTALTTVSKVFPAGLHMITVPAFAGRSAMDQALSVERDKLLLARADGAVTGAEAWRAGDLYRLWPGVTPFQPGYAYWLRADRAVTLSFRGETASKDAPFSQFYAPGWQQFGNPWPDLDVQLRDLQVQAVDGTAAVSLAQAQTLGLVSSGVFGYDPDHGYRLVSADAVLAPYEGHWLNVLAPRGVSVVFPNRASGRRRAVTTAPASGWELRLLARSGALCDETASCGVATGAGRGYSAQDVPKPPPFGPFVSVSFPHGDWGRFAGRYARDMREPEARLSWDLLVETNTASREVTLTWPEMRRVPGGLRLVLTDLDNGAQRLLRTTSAYTFRTGATGTRTLRLTAEPADRARLGVMSLHVETGRGRAGSLSYQLTAPAEVTVTLSSPLGRPLRTLVERRVASRGVDQVPLQAVDAVGRPLPNGLYRVDLLAVGDDGEPVRVSRMVRLER